jgi:glucosyl-3-phosphoglycerate phosphatase
MTRLIVWRHGRTEWNAAGRVQGQLDVDLDDVGQAQAAEVAPRIAESQPDAIISSDLRRAARTAAELAKLTGLDIRLDARLRERDFGPWQGLTGEEIRERYPDDAARWGREGTEAPFSNPEIETVDDMGKRVIEAFREAIELVGDGTCVLVTHGGAARAGCGALLGWPQEVWHTLGGLYNCHFTELSHTRQRGWQLRGHNLV